MRITKALRDWFIIRWQVVDCRLPIISCTHTFERSTFPSFPATPVLYSSTMIIHRTVWTVVACLNQEMTQRNPRIPRTSSSFYFLPRSTIYRTVPPRYVRTNEISARKCRHYTTLAPRGQCHDIITSTMELISRLRRAYSVNAFDVLQY
jgi:hypothetical protein